MANLSRRGSTGHGIFTPQGITSSMTGDASDSSREVDWPFGESFYRYKRIGSPALELV
ncbi:MAG: hypothetical protein WAK26_06665 [Terracidiphilus sp.]